MADFLLVTVNEGGKPPTVASGGSYQDSIVKTADGWRFKRRLFTNWTFDAGKPARLADDIRLNARATAADLFRDGDGDVVVIDQPAVVRERAQHVGARITERRMDGPLVVRRNRRCGPPG
jgi:hypothetical protein